MTIEQRIEAAMPGVNVRCSKHGWEVGGFSMPRPDAQRLLREAGLTVKDVWGQTVVTGSADNA